MPRRRAISQWLGRALRSAASCLNLILACIVYWPAWKIFWVLNECDPVANGIDLSLLERVSPIEWDKRRAIRPVYPHRKLVRRCRPPKGPLLAYKIT